MTDNVQRIIARLDEAEEKKRARRKMLRESLDTCQRLEKEYNDALRTETDPDKYNELITKATENKNRYTALLRQRNQKEAPALSRQEYEDIRKDLILEFEKVKQAHAPKIVEALKNLLTLVNAYDDDVRELEHILNGGQRLAGMFLALSNPFNGCSIKNNAEDFADVLGAFMYGYYINQATFRTYKGNVRP